MSATRGAVPVSLAGVVERLDARGLVEHAPETDVVLDGVSSDSRTATPGDLFCAWIGHAVDSHEYVQSAVDAGAVAALVERPVPVSIPQVVVASGRLAAALAADEIMGRPAESLALAGVTGTNGKTTTVWILRHVLSARWPTASLGTVGAVTEGGRPLPGTGSLTTPGPVGMAKTMRAFADRGVQAVALEVSSHALDQARVHALQFSAAVFTNLSRDHLDYHGSWERYRATKREFVELLGPDGTAILNADERAWDGLERRAPRALRYAMADGPGAAGADVRARVLEESPSGSRFELITPYGETTLTLPLIGAYNVQNAMAAAATALAFGLELEEVVHELSRAPQVPGRLEQVADSPCRVLIDFAHTPDALERVLETVRSATRGRLIVVFGAGGDRDPGKRPLMGQAVAERADLAVVTSDNPRTEDPELIIREILEGMTGGPAEVEWEVDRREAIRIALGRAQSDDVVLLAGKGHETYQVIGTSTVPFNERDIVRELTEAGSGAG